MSHIAAMGNRAQKKEKQGFHLTHKRKLADGVMRPILSAGIFFLFSLGICFRIPSPYAIAALTVLYLGAQKVLMPVIGMCAGVLMRLVWGIDVDLFQMVGCFVVLTLGYSRKNCMKNMIVVTALALLPRVIYAIFTFQTVESLILTCLSIPLGVAALPALSRAMGTTKKGEENDRDAFICRLFPLLVMLLGAARLSLWELNVGFAAATLATLCVSAMLGSGAAICAGLLCGLPIALSGYNPAFMLSLALGGMVTGLFRQKRRMINTLVFFPALQLGAYVTLGAFYPQMLVSCGVACIAFLLIPRRTLDMVAQKLWMVMNSSMKESAYIKTELNALSKSLHRISMALPEIEEPVLEAKEEAERIAASLCIGCEKMPQCFHDNYDVTIDLMQRLASCGGYETVYHKIIQEGFLDCPRAQSIPQLVEEVVDRTTHAQQQAIRAQNEREMLKTHLNAISEQVARIKDRVAGANWSREGMETQVEEILQLNHIPARVLWAQMVDGQASIALMSQTPFPIKPPEDRLLRMLENRFGVPLYIALEEHNKLLIRQTPPIKLISGFASITSAFSPAGAQTPPENGDAFLLREVNNGQLLIALSDGMGHGAQARKESRKTLEMLALCLAAGYTREQTMQAVNGMMLIAAQDERYATVDLCMLDLWSGNMVMNKLGACPSLLIQGRRIEKIVGETLPLGILSHVIPMEHTFVMMDGDLLILMTDGITDAFGTDEALQSVLYRILGEAPQIIADTLLQEALAVVDHRPKDDMSVLVLKTLDNEAARLPRRKNAS